MDIIAGATIDGVSTTPNTLANLEAARRPGATLRLPLGTFSGTAGIANAGELVGAGIGSTIIDATGLAPYLNKAVLVTLVPGITIASFSIIGAAIAETLGGNAAGVRDNGAGIGFRLSQIEISGCQNGVLTFGSDIEISDSYIHDNGSGSGFTHNIYVGGSGDNFLRLTNLKTENSSGGHEVKSRAAHTVSFGCHHTTGGNGSAYDVPDGGQLSISSGSMTIPANSLDHNFLSYAVESIRNNSVGNIVTITDEAFHDRSGSGGLLRSGDPTATLTLSGCTYSGASPPRLSGWGMVNGTITRTV